jgi:hypothetical protein
MMRLNNLLIFVIIVLTLIYFTQYSDFTEGRLYAHTGDDIKVKAVNLGTVELPAVKGTIDGETVEVKPGAGQKIIAVFGDFSFSGAKDATYSESEIKLSGVKSVLTALQFLGSGAFDNDESKTDVSFQVFPEYLIEADGNIQFLTSEPAMSVCSVEIKKEHKDAMAQFTFEKEKTFSMRLAFKVPENIKKPIVLMLGNSRISIP